MIIGPQKTTSDTQQSRKQQGSKSTLPSAACHRLAMPFVKPATTDLHSHCSLASGTASSTCPGQALNFKLETTAADAC